MDRNRVLSKLLKAVGYDANSGTLEVSFRNGGRFQFFAVPAFVYDRLQSAESKVTYIENRVRPHFKFRRLS